MKRMKIKSRTHVATVDPCVRLPVRGPGKQQINAHLQITFPEACNWTDCSHVTANAPLTQLLLQIKQGLSWRSCRGTRRAGRRCVAAATFLLVHSLLCPHALSAIFTNTIN